MHWILVLCWCLPDPAPPLLLPVGIVLDRREALYLEDALEPRPVARVAAALVASAGEVRLHVELAPRGALVDPLPGLAGVPGTNLRTAEELERLLRERALRLVTRAGGDPVPGRLTAIEWGRLPARRLLPDGNLAIDVRTDAAWPVRVAFASAPLPAGESWCYLEADGVPRLSVRIAGGRIAALESLGEREAR